jgi:hypothetical protein
MKTLTFTLACSALVVLSACHFTDEPTQQVQNSKVLEVMVQAGAGNPERWTEQGLAMWFAQHEAAFRQVQSLCAPGGQRDMNPVSNPERLACATVARQQALRNVFGYAPPVASGKAW